MRFSACSWVVPADDSPREAYRVILRVRIPQNRSTVYSLTSEMMRGVFIDPIFCGVNSM